MCDRPGQRPLGPDLRRSEHLPPLRPGSGTDRHWQSPLKAFAIAKHHRIAADRDRDLGFRPNGIDADRGAGRIRIRRPALRLLDLK